MLPGGTKSQNAGYIVCNTAKFCGRMLYKSAKLFTIFLSICFHIFK